MRDTSRAEGAPHPPGLLSVALWSDGHQEWWSTSIPDGSANLRQRCQDLGREPLSCSNGMWRFDIPVSDAAPPVYSSRTWDYRDRRCPHWCTPKSPGDAQSP